MVRRLAGRNARAVSIPVGGRGLQGRDGQMVAIPRGYRGLQGRDGRMVAIPPQGTKRAAGLPRSAHETDKPNRPDTKGWLDGCVGRFLGLGKVP